MKPARNTSPAPVVSTGSTANAGDAHEVPAVEPHRSAFAQRHDGRHVIPLPDDPQRLALVGLPRQVERHLLGKHRVADEAEQGLGPRRDVIDVARHRHAARRAPLWPPRSPPPDRRRPRAAARAARDGRRAAAARPARTAGCRDATSTSRSPRVVDENRGRRRGHVERHDTRHVDAAAASSPRIRRPSSSAPTAPTYFGRRPRRAHVASAVAVWPPHIRDSPCIRTFDVALSGRGNTGSRHTWSTHAAPTPITSHTGSTRS